MELFLSQRYNNFRRVLQTLYEATCLQSRLVPAEGYHRGLRGLFHDLRGYQAKRTFLFWIRNPKSKRNVVEEILDNLLFSYWLLVVSTI